MREQPDGKALLAIARQVLKESVLPHLPKDQVYNGLMIANAMAIAARQFDDESIEQEWNLLQKILSDNDAFAQENTLKDNVKLANQILAKKIRAGEFDSDNGTQPLADALSFQVLQRLQESNPKAMP